MDGTFYKIGNLVADLFVLTVLWILCSLPLVTAGASTTAVYYVATKRISGREGYIARDFFKSFRKNFVTATAVFALLAAVIAVAAVNIIYIIFINTDSGSFFSIVLPFQFAFILEAVFVGIFAFPLLSRFDMKFKVLMKSAFVMANRHILTTLLCLCLFLAILLVCFLYLPAAILSIGGYCYLSSFLLMKRFKKYRPDLDPEDS